MAVPKRKVSKARRNSRNSSNFKVVAPTLVECPTCHELKVPHKVCKKCGSYDGKKVIEDKKEKKAE
ncbi:MAG: 50S ribosomal protein L32 [Christensenellales bacterium]|nr:50S ribosomal protein L32 [Bacillota bacterium]MDY3659163.1 50S ribosomal protein L32 [Eubacteriales bacterium]